MFDQIKILVELFFNSFLLLHSYKVSTGQPAYQIGYSNNNESYKTAQIVYNELWWQILFDFPHKYNSFKTE